MKFYNDIVLKLMKDKGISKNKLAGLIGVTQPAVSAWINGLALPRERNVYLISKVLKVAVSNISDLEEIEDIAAEVSGYFQGWGASLDKNKEELDNPCIRAIKEIENIKSEQHRLRTVNKAFMTTMQSMLYVKNYYGEYIVANESYLKALSLDININIIGKSDKDIMSQRVASANNTQDMSIIHTGKPIIKKSVKFPFTNSKIKWCVMTKVPLKDNRQNIIGVVASFTDITEVYELRSHDKMLNEAIKQSNSAIGIASISSSDKTKFVYANEALEKILGYGSSDFKNDIFCWIENVVDNSKGDMEKYLEGYKEELRAVSFYYKHPESKKEKYLTIKSSKVKETNLVYHCLYDETEKKNQEELVELLEASIDQSNYDVYIEDISSGKPVYIPNSVKEFYGYNREDFLKDPFFYVNNCVYPEDKNLVSEYTKILKGSMSNINSLVSKNTKHYQYRVITKSGKVKWVEGGGAKILFNDKEYLLYISYDITERKEKEIKTQEVIEKLKLLTSFIDNINYAVFISKFVQSSDSQTKYFYRNKKTYEYINDNEIFRDMYAPEQRNEILEKKKSNKYPRILRYNIIKKNLGICTVEEKAWLQEFEGNKFILFEVKEIDRQDNVEIIYN